MREGILVGGNWIIDQVKVIDVYPEEEKLVNIFTQSSCNGGSAYNVITGLEKLKSCMISSSETGSTTACGRR